MIAARASRTADLASSTSPPMCPAAVRRPAPPRRTSSPPTRRRSGPRPKAIAASSEAAGDLERYPDGRAAAARRDCRPYGLNPANIVCGNGSDELLSLIAHVYLGPGDEAIYHRAWLPDVQDPDAGGRRHAGRGAGDGLHAPTSTRSWRAVTPKTKVVFIANPNNPTGTYVPFEEVRRLHAGLPKQRVLVLDAAYSEYVRRNDYEAGVELVATHRQRGDDAHLLEDLRAGRRCGSAGSMRRLPSSTCSTACAGRSTSTRRRSRPASRRSATAPMSSAPSPTTSVAALADRRSSASSGSR